MPEMTPERIASLAQSAKERDPNPEPLSVAEAADAGHTVIVGWTRGDGTVSTSTFTGSGVKSYEVSPEGDLSLSQHDDVVIFARGAWQYMTTFAVEDAR